MNTQKWPPQLEKTGEILIRLRQIEKKAKKCADKYTTWLSQMIADHGLTGKWEADRFPGCAIRSYKMVGTVKDKNDPLTEDEQKTLVGRNLAKHSYKVDPEKLEALLSEKEITRLVNGGALEKNFKAVGGPGSQNIILYPMVLDSDSDIEAKIEQSVNDNIIEWKNPHVAVFLSKENKSLVWIGAAKDEEEDHCELCGEVPDEPLIEVPAIGDDLDMLLCADCWVENRSHDLVYEIEVNEEYLESDLEDN